MLQSKYDIGEYVYILTDPDARLRMVVSVKFTLTGGIYYGIATSDSDEYFSAIEITRDKQEMDLNKVFNY